MLKGKERWGIYMRATLGATPKGAPGGFDLADVIRDLEAGIGTDKAVHFREADRRWTRLMDVKWYPSDHHPQVACLLLTVGDRDAAEQGFQHMDTGNVRIPKRHDKEGNARSAHLLISLKKVNDGYAALLEDMEGLGKTNLKESLSGILRKGSTYRFIDGDEVEHDCWPTFEIDAVEDKDLSKELSSDRKLRYFELVKEGMEDSFDEQTESIIEKETLRVTLDDQGMNASTLMGRIRALIRAGRSKGYTKIKVVYKRADKNGNKTVTYNTQREDAEDFLIKRVERISLSENHPGAREKVSEELGLKLKGLLDRWSAE